jgi:signal transduction histidine kinase
VSAPSGSSPGVLTRAPEGAARALAARWRSGNAWWQDSVLAVVLAAVAFAPPLAANGVALGELGHHRLGIAGSLLSAAQAVPLAARRRWPGWTLAVVGAAFGVYQIAGYRSTFASVGLFIALYSAGAHQVRYRRPLAAAATAGYAVLAAILASRGSPERVIDWITFYLLLVACWGAGAVIRSRAVAGEARRQQSVELAMAGERARIARELHDVVTHHVTAMVVQADATQFVLETAPDRAADGLGAISGTGRRALADLRHLLGVLESPGGGQDERAGEAGRAPVTGSLPDLVARINSAGHPAELIEKGHPEPMAVGTRLAVYRVVQEGLTNAMKHASGQPTVAEVRYGDDEISVEVSNDGPVQPDGSFPAGRGLTGLRERVSRCGGNLSASARPEGGFSVRARLPRIPAQVEP